MGRTPRRSALRAAWPIVVLAIAACAPAAAEERRGRVEALDGDEVVIDLGSRDGAVVGIVVDVRRDGRAIARVVVTEAREATARGRIAEARRPVQTGDEVVLGEALGGARGGARGGPVPPPGLPPATAAIPPAPPVAASISAPAAPAAPARGPDSASGPDSAPSPPAGPGQAPPPLPPEEVLRRLRAAPTTLRVSPTATGAPTPPGGERASAPAGPTGAAGAGAAATGGAAARTPASSRPGTEPAAPPPANVLTGSARLAYDASLDHDGFTDYTRHGPRADLAFTLSRIGGEDLTLRFRGRLRALFADERGDRTGGDIDTQAYLDEASLEWRPAAAPLRFAVGRIGLYDAATVGGIDGARAALLLGPVEVGAFGGLDPRPDLSDRGRTKWGGYVRLGTPPAEHVAVDAALAFARTTTPDGAVDRQLVAADARVRLSPWLTVYGRAEVDLYGATGDPADHGGTVLTSVYAYASIRPLPDLDLGISFDRRVPFIGVEAIEDLPLEARALVSEQADDPYTTVRLDARYRLPHAWWVRGAVDLRRGGAASTTVTGAVGWDAVFGAPAWASVEGRGWTGDLVEGGGARVRVGAALVGPLEADFSYEVTLDRYQDSLDEVLRHAIGIDAFLYLDRAWSASLSVGYEIGDDIDRAYAHIDLVWRF